MIQDVDIPLENSADFLRFFLATIPIRPVWICPIGGHDPSKRFPLYPLGGGGFFVNFGFWDVMPSAANLAPGHFNRLIEDKVRELGGGRIPARMALEKPYRVLDPSRFRQEARPFERVFLKREK